MLLLGYLLLALVVAAVLFYLVVAFLPSGLSVRPVRDDRPLELPASRRMRLGDLDRVRIPVTIRGYRFAETDELIDRLAAEIVVRDEEIARLRQQGYPLDADRGAEPVADRGAEPVADRGAEPVAGPGASARSDTVPEPEWAVREMGEEAAAEVAQFEAVHPGGVDTDVPEPDVPEAEEPTDATESDQPDADEHAPRSKADAQAHDD